jgi:hypothetical protein
MLTRGLTADARCQFVELSFEMRLEFVADRYLIFR